LSINFPIPSFHKSVATENGRIYLIGGTIMSNMQKSTIIYQFNPMANSLKQVSAMNVGRSSQSMVCLKNMIYITGGMSNEEQVLNKC
jgi:N-acetylneuraminic acid mutarotase